ncbi:MAG TPA: TRAP transporter large permease subunit [Syntrophomonadaceae bacterium]|mgnify:CR=1 FL=1|nr:TRAP transporter large permease subunit [Syntrophomonadaceae bacterium]HQE23030.1 TRAP transporter large permease subunit [Syntrophomonadaceae bacterium]
MVLAVFFVSLFVFLLTGIPIAFVLLLCAVALMQYMGIFDAQIMAQQMVNGTNNFPLMAIPFFMLSGEIMTAGGLSRRIVEFANILLGRIKGGLGYAGVLASMLFAGLSGSAVADTAALGGLMVPMMEKQGYKVERATGLVAAGGIIAPLIPPSIPMIVFGVTCGLSITKLFMIGLFPGIMLGLALMIAWFFVVRRDGYDDRTKFTFKESMRVVTTSIPALLMPVIIIGGIRFGVFTPTEAGAFAVVYALLVSIFVYREMNFNSMVHCLVEASKMTAVVMFVVAAATVVGWIITVAQIPTLIANTFGALASHKLLLLIIINLFLLALGMVMDLTPAILIFAPVLLPLVTMAGIDPYFFGLIMVFNLCIGLITPPVGTILYLGCGIGHITFTRMVRGIIPFLITELIVLFMFVFFPDLVMVPLSWVWSGS